MEKQMIRPLKAEEIECRASVIRGNGLSLLLYKDARVDQRILDETFGPFGWKRSHQSIDGNLYCTVEIYDKSTGIWVSKQDVGTTGYAEKEKSQASDSFKRACFNWGIGRELYTAPFIWIPVSCANIQQKGDRFYCNDHFSVRSIAYGVDGEIVYLVIANDTQGKIVFELTLKNEPNRQAADNTDQKRQHTIQRCHITETQIHSLENELKRTGVNMKTVQERYHINGLQAMTEELYTRVMNALAKTKSVETA